MLILQYKTPELHEQPVLSLPKEATSHNLIRSKKHTPQKSIFQVFKIIFGYWNI